MTVNILPIAPETVKFLQYLPDFGCEVRVVRASQYYCLHFGGTGVFAYGLKQGYQVIADIVYGIVDLHYRAVVRIGSIAKHLSFTEIEIIDVK